MTMETTKKKPSFLRRRWLSVLMATAVLGWITFINLPGVEFAATTAPNGKATIASTSKPFHIELVYSPNYLISLGGLEKIHPFDIRKYEKIEQALIQDGLCRSDDIHRPEAVSEDDLLLVHTPGYLKSLKSRSQIATYLEAPILQFAPVSLDRAVLKPFRSATGGTLLASKFALASGIGINIGGGYHHAKPDTGEGFCIYADVAIAIRRLQKDGRINRAVVIDVDAHQGNGTADCLANDDTTFTFSIHQGDIYPYDKSKSDLDIEISSGTDDVEYMTVLNKHLDRVLDDSSPDICFVVAGCDPLGTDPLAGLSMTPQGIVQRDARIVSACVERRLPFVFTLSGGYSPDAWRTQYESIAGLIRTYGLSERE